MFSNGLGKITIGRNMSELWQIVCKKCNIYIGGFVGFIVRIVYHCKYMNISEIGQSLG
jgi:hypothetical protein